MPSRGDTCLGILAGGQGTRLGGVDKALLVVEDQFLLDRLLHRLGAGFGAVLVSYNRTPPTTLGWPGPLRFVGDDRAAGEGPLAGLAALLDACAQDWLLTVPVDLAAPGADLVELLLAQPGGAVLHDAEGRQPLVSLWPVTRARAQVREALEQGRRAVHPVLEALDLVTASLSRRLGNINTPEDWQALR